MTLRRRLVTTLARLATVAGSLVPVAPAAASRPCYDATIAGTVEERRLGPVPAQLLARTGFDRQVARFSRALCAFGSARAAGPFVRSTGERLWSAATHRAQTPQHAPDLPATDDRGLYWARISMAKALRWWTPRAGLSDADRATLIKSFEYASRGITSSRFTAGVRRVLVTGFDPFTLDADIRIGNPSGANALNLDGVRWTVGGRQVEIQTVVFPVRYADFDQRMVEDALIPHYRPGRQRAELVTTVSQGRVGIFDLEVRAPVVAPGMPPGPEWLTSSLPVTPMAAVDVNPFRTRINTSVLEIPAGGGYLSNEVAYRNRDTIVDGAHRVIAAAVPAITGR